MKGPKRKNMSGQKYGKLEVISYHHTSTDGHSFWKCKCECGNESIVKGTHLKRKKTTSCGCVSRRNATLRMRARYRSDSWDLQDLNENW